MVPLMFNFNILFTSIWIANRRWCVLSQGTFVATPLGFVFPSLVYMKSRGGKWFSKDNIAAWLLLVMALIIMVVGCINSIVNYSVISLCSHGQQMSYCSNPVNSSISTTELSFWKPRGYAYLISVPDCLTLSGHLSSNSLIKKFIGIPGIFSHINSYHILKSFFIPTWFYRKNSINSIIYF